MKYIQKFEKIFNNTNINSRKSGNFLIVKIDNTKYKCWFWNPRSIESSFMDKLVAENSWLIEIEDSNGDSKSYKIENCLKISPYYKGYEYLNNKNARQILIDKAEEYHYSKKYKTFSYNI